MIHKKFDLIFSLGEACSCTQTLRKFRLQTHSYPFDWLLGSTFVGKCNILANKFKNYIEKEDLEYVFSYGKDKNKMAVYYNKNNDITFNHDFYEDIQFDDAYPKIKTKYERRIKRLLKKIAQSHSVLVVFIECPYTKHNIITNDEIIKGYSILKNVFGEKINLLYLKNDNHNDKLEFFENNKITKITKDYKDYNSNVDYEVDFKKLEDIFSKYKLNLPFYYIASKKLLKFLINFIPIKSKRHELRKKLHL